MEPKIHTLTIERFRAIRQLKIEGLGRVNLITGKNNTGKSSVLEALRLLASEGSPAVIDDILRLREEKDGDPSGSQTMEEVSGLFRGFPRFSNETEPIVISSRAQASMKVTLKMKWIPRHHDRLGRKKSVRGVPTSDEEELTQALEVDSNGDTHLWLGFCGHSVGKEPPIPCEFLGPLSGGQTGALAPLFDKIALTEFEEHVLHALQIIDSRISGVRMVGGETPNQERRAIVRAEGFPRPVPLRTFGDGLNRLFGIALSLVNAKGGFLLIDEFENGMHHTVQTDVWRAIFKLAKDLDIQVFATSHSWDSIEAFQKAASEVPEEGVLIRLTRKGRDIIPTVLSEDELAIAARDRIEVR